MMLVKIFSVWCLAQAAPVWPGQQAILYSLREAGSI